MTSVRRFAPKVRGLRPRDWIRGVVDVTGSAVENAVAIGHAERPQPVNRGRHATQGRTWRWGDARNRRCPSTDGGAPGTVRPTTRNVTFSNKPASSVNQRKGRRGRRPLRWLRVGRCQRSRKVQFITPVTFYAASPVSLLHVGCTVLGAPRSRDHRGGIDASARVDRF